VGGGCQTLIYKWRFDQKTCNTASFTFFSSSFWFDLDLFTLETNVFMFRGEIIEPHLKLNKLCSLMFSYMKNKIAIEKTWHRNMFCRS